MSFLINQHSTNERNRNQLNELRKQRRNNIINVQNSNLMNEENTNYVNTSYINSNLMNEENTNYNNEEDEKIEKCFEEIQNDIDVYNNYNNIMKELNKKLETFSNDVFKYLNEQPYHCTKLIYDLLRILNSEDKYKYDKVKILFYNFNTYYDVNFNKIVQHYIKDFTNINFNEIKRYYLLRYIIEFLKTDTNIYFTYQEFLNLSQSNSNSYFTGSNNKDIPNEILDILITSEDNTF